MKKINLIGWLSRNSHEKQKPQRFARYAAMLIMLLTLGVGQMWAADTNLPDGSILYCNVTNTNFSSASAKMKFNFQFNDNGYDTRKGTQISGTNVWYVKVPANVKSVQILRENPSNWNDQWGYSGTVTCSSRSTNSQNCVVVSGSNYDNATISWDSYTPTKKTIHVHVPEGWSSPKLYTWFTDPDSNDQTTNGNWPGTNGSGQNGQSISNTSGNWYDVTIAVINSKFILAKDNDTKTSDLTYSGVTGGEYYIAAASTTLTAVTKPTVTSSAASSVTYSSAVFNGNVTAMGNDPDISSYGFYWSSSSFSTADVSGCTKVDLGSKAATGAFTYTATGLSAETTYYFVSYATNHKGTSYGTVRYFTTEEAPVVPTLTLDAVSPSSMVSGNDVTITTTRSNTTNAITFEYTTNNGSTWSSLTPKSTSNSGQTAVWTIPEAHGATQTYKFRAKIVDDALTTSASSAVTVYGKKTIKVKNTNGWVTFNSYVYDHDGSTTTAKREEWPGSTTGVTSAGGQWKQVVLTSQYKYFILNDGGTSEQLSGETYTYASSVSDGSSYAIGGSGSTCTLSSTSAPTAPTSVTTSTSAPTGLTDSQMTIHGSIGTNGNDNITDYGFYWGTTSACGTKAQVGTSNTTGSISKQLTGLTAGTTYYFKTYATNGQGTSYGDVQSYKVPYKVTISTSTGCTSISPSGTQYTNSTISVTATKTTGYTFSSWSITKGTETSTSSTSTTNTIVFTPSANNATIQPTYTENEYSTNVAVSPAGYGSISSPTPSTGKINVKQVTGTAVTAAVASSNYIFESWSKTGGGLTVSSTTTNPATFKATSADGTITANFADVWNLKGNQWSSWGTYKPMTATGNANEFSTSLTLTKGTNYLFKVVKRNNNDGESDTWYGNKSGLGNKVLGRGDGAFSTFTGGGNDDNISVTADVNGTYTFTINTSGSTPSITVTFQAAYTVTFGSDGHASSVTASATSAGGSFTSGDYVASGEDVTFTQTANTGYEFKGWYTTADGNTTVTGMGTSDHVLDDIAANTNVYAQYNAKTYTVTLNQQEDADGYDSDGDEDLIATFDAAFPSATMPTAANGWAFMGYWSEEGGEGTQFTDEDGVLLANIADYSDASGHWIYDDDDLTLYAYYKKAEITGITLSASTVEPETTITATPTVAPTPEGTTSICWRVLYYNGTPLASQPTFTPGSGSSVSFSAPEASGTYKLEAKLHKGSECGGDLLDTRETTFQVAGLHDVTVRYKCGSTTVKAASTLEGIKPLEWSDEITAPDDIFGYTFSYWEAGDGVTLSKNGTSELGKDTAHSASIYIKAIFDGELTAVYTEKSLIYFKNTLGWSSVYVNFYGEDYWGYGDAVNKGSGNKDVTNRNKAMTQIGETGVWYYDYGAASITPSRYVSFTEHEQEDVSNGYQFFWESGTGVNVVYPARRGNDLADKATALGFYAKTPMFVPLASQTPVVKNDDGIGKANYYNDGYWTKYMAGTGYTLEVYYNNDASECIKSIPFSSADELMPMKAVADLEANTTYRFQLKRDGDVYYGNSGVMDYSNHGTTTGWEASNEASCRNDADNADVFCKFRISTNASGNYTFNLSYSGDNSVPIQYRLRIGVDYPIADGDYRLVYSDATQTKAIKSAIVTKANNSKDTVSFFIRPKTTPVLKIQQSSVTDAGVITWNDLSTITSSVSGLPKDSVYNIYLTMDGSGAISVENVEGYTGNFYIRTDAAGASKWDSYKSTDHLMTYSEYAANKTGSDFTHYFMAFMGEGSNVKFVVANDYAPNISDTLIVSSYRGGDSDHVDASGNLKTGASANIRYMWDMRDNKVIRAYLAAAKTDGSRFLVMQGQEDELLAPNGDALSGDSEANPGNNHGGGANAIQFSDTENWMYEANVRAVPGGRVKLYAVFNGSTFYYYGDKDASFDGSHAIDLITGNGGPQNIRAIYDFKTDRLIAAWMPSDAEISTKDTINADVMLVRTHQEDGQQINLTGSGSITTNKTVYGVMQFNRYTLHNRSKEEGHAVLPVGDQKSQYERFTYYISFPFDVKLGEIFGFGTVGREWRISYYDGKGRAEEGFFAERTSNWRMLDDTDSILHKYQGYLLQLNTVRMGYNKTETGEIWANGKEDVELYFPAMGTINTISLDDIEIPALGDAYKCKINLQPTYHALNNPDSTEADRRVKDSYWRCIGVPGFTSYKATASSWTNFNWQAETDSLPYLYEWEMNDNKLSVVSSTTFTFKPMHAYLIQNGNSFTWTSVAVPSASSIVARRQAPASEDRFYEFYLKMQKDDQTLDHTYVRLTNNENVTTDFDFGQDLSKELNANYNIYTKVGYERLAANNLPMSDKTTIVPVGMTIAEDGYYTFSMPEGTHGIGVVLVDNLTGERTTLSMFDHSVNLVKGTYNDRFFLEISPIKQIVTDVEEVSGDELQVTGARKVMIDGLLYIVRDGKMFDAQGRQVK